MKKIIYSGVILVVICLGAAAFYWRDSLNFGKNADVLKSPSLQGKAEDSADVTESTLKNNLQNGTVPSSSVQTPPASDFVKIGQGYDTIFSSTIMEVNGKLLYEVQDHGKSYILYDGQEIGKQYDNIQSITKIGNKFAFLAIKDHKAFVVYDGSELGKEYYAVTDLYEAGGKLIYFASNPTNSGGVEYFMIFDGKVIGEDNGSFSSLKEYFSVVDGKLIYRATIDHKKYFIVHEGKKFGEEYDMTYLPAVVNGKLAYSAMKNGKGLVVYDSAQVSKEYDSASNPVNVNNKLAYFADKGTKWFVVYDSKQSGKEYDKKDTIFVGNSEKEIGGKLAYKAVDAKSHKPFIVYDGEELGKNYDSSTVSLCQ